MAHARHFDQCLLQAFRMTLLQVVEEVAATNQAVGALGFGGAALVERWVVGVDIQLAQQISHLTTHVGLFDLVGSLFAGVARQLVHPVLPVIEGRADFRVHGLWSLRAEVAVRRRVGDHVAQLDAGLLQVRAAFAHQHVTLHHLATARMPGDDHFT